MVDGCHLGSDLGRQQYTQEQTPCPCFVLAGRTGWGYYVSVESRDEDSTRLETTVTTRVWET